MDQLPTSVASIAQFIRALHQNPEDTSSNPVEVLTFSGFSTQLQKLASITVRIIAYLTKVLY